jgi:flavin reductase (DIM6/NTAB) family NADH-FMN oxidoreductase RutF
MVLNFLTEDHWATIETLGELTGASPVPREKPQTCQYEPDKFSAAGWSALPSESVRPHRVAEASVHVEARVTSMDPELQNLLVVRARSSVVHADEGIVIDGTSYVDPLAWRPLIYSFRHYFGLGERVGIAGPAEVRR